MEQQCLDNAPATIKFLEGAIAVPLDDIPQFVWTNGYQGTSEERHPGRLQIELQGNQHLSNKRKNIVCRTLPSNIQDLRSHYWIGEQILIESSSNDSADTLKQMRNTSNDLHVQRQKYTLASFDTFTKLQIFGIHFIRDKLTLTSTSFIQVRSATIPKIL
ncbi:unnamed protein product [Absidia cylindrospora]